MIISNTVRRTKRNSSTRLNKIQERKVVRLYLDIIVESLLKGYRFDLPNAFGTLAVVQRDKSHSGKSASRNIAPEKMFEQVKSLDYKGVITENDTIKFIPSQKINSLIKKQAIKYRSEIILQ